MLIFYATAEVELASDVGTSAGPYANVLAEEIVKSGIEAVTMFRLVQRRVRMTIKQEPYLGFNVMATCIWLVPRRLRRRPRGRMPTSPVIALDAISTKRASGLFWRQAGSRRTNPSRCSTACIPRTLPCSYRGYRLRTIYWLLCRRDFGNIGTNPCSLLLQMRLRQACQVRAPRLKRLASALRSCPLEHPLEIYRATTMTAMPPV